MDAIVRDRDYENVDRELIKSTVKSYKSLGLKGKPETKLVESKVEWVGDADLKFYLDHFEPHFLESARLDFDKKSSAWISTFNVHEYLEKIN